MATLTGVFYEGDGFIRRGLADVPATKPAPQAVKAVAANAVGQGAATEAVAKAWEPAAGYFELQMQARAARREHVNQWFHSLFGK